MHIVVVGVNGRMGREVVATLPSFGDVLVGGLGRPSSSADLNFEGGAPLDALDDDAAALIARSEVVIDFSSPAGTLSAAAACAAAGVPLVSGTTGLDAAQMASLHAAAGAVPVFYARNMSLGIAALLATLPALTAALAGFDVEIVETHHRHKVDAPSGTALTLADAIVAARASSLAGATTIGREGEAPRQPGEIGIHAVRGGGNTGEHQVIFAADGEEVRVNHRSFSRRAYAEGAIRAAHFVRQQPPGWYTLSDLIAAPT